MAISRMQQPRQMYGLGSFVKKLTRKVTRPITKIAKKFVPKEIAGIMRVAAPFLPPQFRTAAYLLGTARQTGRISPVDLALIAAPKFFSKTKVGQGIADRVGNLTLPGMDRNLREVMVGTPEITSRGPKILDGSPIRSPVQSDLITRETLTGFGDPRTVEATSGLFGKGGEMFQLGKEDGPGILDTQVGRTFFGKEKGGEFVPSLTKIGSIGAGVLTAVTAAKTPDEAGEALVAQTGDPAAYEEGVQLFSTLKPGIFDIPERFRLPSANGGLMRTNYAQGTLNPQVSDLFAGMRPQKQDFFEDLFLKREGGGGRDFMISDEAKTRDDLNEVFNYMGDDMAKAKELEANKIFEVLNDKTMQILDVVLDMPDSEEKDKILYDINQGILNKQKDSGMAKIANARYETIQKYGYLLDDKKRGLGNIMADPQNKANGGLMRTNYAIGSDDKGVVNPFQPKPQGPVLPEEDKPFRPKPLKPLKMSEDDDKGIMMMAASDRYQRILEQLINELEDQLGRELTDAEYDMAGQMAYERLSDSDYAVGGRVDYALGTKPTAEESGLGGLPIEADMRYTGGFMPYGAKEKADDVPARLSKNEFVFTADAVRAAGGGSVNEGAKKMYQTMKQLEAKPEAKGMTA